MKLPDVANLKASALVCRGVLDSEPDLLVQAAEQFASGGRLPAEAAAREDAGFVLVSAGRRREARQQFGQALDIYARLGASRDLARGMARMRAAGIRRGIREPHRRATSGWDALTATEVKIAQLAAQGRTNPEIGAQLFISRRTVQTHLSHVFVKLDISSRVELALIASRRSS
jgi:DNA-binding CsgD family transcriptional regulator